MESLRLYYLCKFSIHCVVDVYDMKIQEFVLHSVISAAYMHRFNGILYDDVYKIIHGRSHG